MVGFRLARVCAWIACAFVKMEHAVFGSLLIKWFAFAPCLVGVFVVVVPYFACGRTRGTEGQSLCRPSSFAIVSVFTRYLVYMACLCLLACFSIRRALLWFEW